MNTNPPFFPSPQGIHLYQAWAATVQGNTAVQAQYKDCFTMAAIAWLVTGIHRDGQHLPEILAFHPDAQCIRRETMAAQNTSDTRKSINSFAI